MSTANFKHQKWVRNLEEIHDTVFFLQFNNKEFHSLAERFNNKDLPFEIFRFCRRNYSTFMSMAIRRLVDRHRDADSLIKLLDDVEKNASAYKRSWFLRQYADAKEEPLFEEFFGSSEVLKKEIVENDIKRLLYITQKITNYADKWEAHWDKDRRNKTINPTHLDLDMAVRCIVDIYKRYYYLLKQNSIEFKA